MRTFKATEESKASQKGDKYVYPDRLSVAVFLDRMKWSYFEYIATPSHVIDEIRMKWHLDAKAQEAQERKAKVKP